jgi:antirestriction protein ArdC
MKKQDHYTEIANRVATAIDEVLTGKREAPPWVRPWNAVGTPHNGSSGHEYRGMNVWLTWIASYADPRWYTFGQVQKINGFEKAGRGWKWAGNGDAPSGLGVRKGQKGTKITFWKKMTKRDRDDDGTETLKSFMMLKVYTVFNHEQINWAPGKERPLADLEVLAEDPRETYNNAQDFVDATGAEITHDAAGAWYIPGEDRIQLPPATRFHTPDSYWSACLHELGHWTKKPERCDRDLDRAMEELVAELTSSFLCCDLGIRNELHPENEAYLVHWAGHLREQPKAIFTAASKARLAAEYLTDAAGSDVDALAA